MKKENQWRLCVGYVFNPLIPREWNEQTALKGYLEFVDNLMEESVSRVGMSKISGDIYTLDSKVKMSLGILTVEDLERNGETPRPMKSIIYNGVFDIKKNEQPFRQGTVWQNLPWIEKNKDYRTIPRVFDMAMGFDLGKLYQNYKRMIEVLSKYEESLDEFYRLEEIRNERKELLRTTV